MSRLRNNKGQILVEYLLLMVIAVSCAVLLTKQLIARGDSRDTDSNKNGIIIRAWQKIIYTIGSDVPDCTNQTDFSTNNCPP